METQTNNSNIPQNEVDELREQLALFKHRLDQQEIISDRLMRRSMNARISIFTKWSVISDIAGLLLMCLIVPLLHKIGVSWSLGIILIIGILIELAYNISCHRRLQRLFAEGNDLLTVRRGLLKFKKAERLQLLMSLPLIFLWLLAFYWQVGVFDGELRGGASAAGLVSSIVGIVLGLFICFGFFVWEMHRVNRSVREIDELSKE
jgi:hypothetical protein